MELFPTVYQPILPGRLVIPGYIFFPGFIYSWFRRLYTVSIVDTVPNMQTFYVKIKNVNRKLMKITLRRGIDILMLEEDVSSQFKEMGLLSTTIYCFWNSFDLFPSR